MPPCGTSRERASEARLSDNVAFLSQNQQRTGFLVESFTGVEGGACARRSSGFFYSLVRRTAKTSRSWLCLQVGELRPRYSAATLGRGISGAK